MKFNRRPTPTLRTLAILPAILLFSACNTLQTSSEPVGSSSRENRDKAHVGLYYFLPKALIAIDGKQDVVRDKDGNPIATVPFTITIRRIIVPDRKQRYFVRWTQNAVYDDKLDELMVDADGLLTSVKFDATDQTPAIVKDLVDTTINVFRIAGGGGPKILGVNDATSDDEFQPFSYTFDPLDSAEVEAVCARLATHNKLELVVSTQHTSVRSDIGKQLATHQPHTTNNPDRGTVDSPEQGGVFYRPPTTVEMRLRYTDYKKRVVQRTAITVPDPGSLTSFRFGRSPLVKRSTQLALVAGMPTRAFVERPSPAKSFTGLLKDVSETIANAVPTIVNVEDNRTRADLANQKSLLDAQTGTLNSQKALNDAQAALLASQPGGQIKNAAAEPVSQKSEQVEKAEFLLRDSVNGPKNVKEISEAFVKEAQANATKAEAEAKKAGQ